MTEAKRGRFAAFVLRWTWVVFVGGWLATAAAFCASFTWWLELAAHFHVQYIYGGLLCAVVFLVVRSKRSALVALALVVVNGIVIAPAFFAPSERVAGDRPLKLLIVNLHSPNTNYTAVLDLVAAEEPDLLLFAEATPEWVQGLAPLAKEYSHQVTQPRGDNFGILLWSKLPMQGDLRYFGMAQVPSVEASLDVGGMETHILLTHPLPPMRARHVRLRDEQLRNVARRAKELGKRTIVCGDFNVTPWAPIFDEVLSLGALRDSSLGFGVQPTWTTMFPWFTQIPIDHCLCAEEVHVIDRRIGPDIGSDHLPLIVEVR